jgi:hypothetical protein
MASAGRPRKNSNKLDLSYDCILDQLSIMLRELTDVRAKAMRDYNEIKRNTEGNEDRVMLENVRNNTFKSFEYYFKLKLDTLKVLATVTMKANGSKEIEESIQTLNSDDKENLYEKMQELKESMQKRNNDN